MQEFAIELCVYILYFWVDCFKSIPLYCSYEYAEKIAEKTKMRLPNETEWEYFARAGCNSLFPFGDELLEENDLEKWLYVDFRK